MIRVIILALILGYSSTFPQEDSSKVALQNPSPMVDYTRKHERIFETKFQGISFSIDSLTSKPIEIYIPKKSQKRSKFDLVIHFHGNPNIVKYAADKYNGSIIAAILNLGSGSKRYYNQFEDSTLFKRIIDSVIAKTKYKIGVKPTLKKVILTGFSAGYGAIKKLLETHSEDIDAVLLLDGLHASYIPDRKVLSEGGKIDSSAFDAFLRFALEASKEKSAKKFLITHSEIFPGTFVSTTEATDYILSKLKMRRKPILKWGPLGMQQLSYARKNHFMIMGFAGNSAPDHMDHLHAIYHFLNKLLNL
ncbi:hypothetical protein ABRY23_03985 [Melioribacteraceae bacterium 4301-Me]|uniref:hypothetical protein n=1 Tax=Pyranulibacter aquaticus TaxID=3163344 RepID=UPI0035993B6C